MKGSIESVRRTTESSVAAQQEMFHRWVSMWPWVPASAFPFGQMQKLQEAWVEMVGDLVERQNHLLATQLKLGFGTVERLFRLAEVKDPEQLRTRTVEVWRKAFDYLWMISAAQVRSLENALGKLSELAHREDTPADPTFRVPVANDTKPRGEAPRRPAKARSDREELEEALEEYEMARGDWSKGH
jgi:hypothetical protein